MTSYSYIIELGRDSGASVYTCASCGVQFVITYRKATDGSYYIHVSPCDCRAVKSAALQFKYTIDDA
jgi:hypothetical protein